MEILAEMFKLPVVSRAMAVGVLVSLCAALLGVILVQKKYSMMGHALSDVGFAALSFALAFDLSPMAVCIPVVVVSAILIMWISRRGSINGDTAIGMVATASLAFGVIITSVNGGFNIDVTGYMFGSILATTESDVLLSVILSVIVIGVFLLCYNRLFSITYDETYAAVCGIPVAFYQVVIAVLTGFTIVLGMRLMGTMLISSLIIFPAVAAKNLVRSFGGVIAVSAVISVLSVVTGLVVSFLLDLPAGATIVGMDVIIMLLSKILSPVKSK